MNQQLFPHFFTFSVQNRNMTTFILLDVCGLGYFHHTLSQLIFIYFTIILQKAQMAVFRFRRHQLCFADAFDDILIFSSEKSSMYRSQK